MPKAAPQVELTPEQVQALDAWNQAAQQLAAAKSDELVKRMEAIKLIPFSEEKQEGSQSVKLHQGWTLKLDRPMNYTMDKDNGLVTAALSKLAEVNPGAAQELMRWEAVCSTGAYKKLTDEERLIVAPVITIKPGTPSLTLSPPPVKKD
jgi:hypothetical protein